MGEGRVEVGVPGVQVGVEVNQRDRDRACHGPLAASAARRCGRRRGRRSRRPPCPTTSRAEVLDLLDGLVNASTACTARRPRPRPGSAPAGRCRARRGTAGGGGVRPGGCPSARTARPGGTTYLRRTARRRRQCRSRRRRSISGSGRRCRGRRSAGPVSRRVRRSAPLIRRPPSRGRGPGDRLPAPEPEQTEIDEGGGDAPHDPRGVDGSGLLRDRPDVERGRHERDLDEAPQDVAEKGGDVESAIATAGSLNDSGSYRPLCTR